MKSGPPTLSSEAAWQEAAWSSYFKFFARGWKKKTKQNKCLTPYSLEVLKSYIDAHTVCVFVQKYTEKSGTRQRSVPDLTVKLNYWL